MHPLLAKTTAMLAAVRPDLAEESAREIKLRIGTNATQDDVQAEINRYWRMQLAMLTISTFSVRECLLDNQPIDAWLRNFEHDVVPFVKRHVKR